MHSLLSALFLTLTTIPYVAAHGWVTNVTIDGKVYQGNWPGQTPPIDSPIREVKDTEPVKDTSSADLACGRSAERASEVALAKPGSNISFAWISGSAQAHQHWLHYVGPIMTYAAACEDVTCDKFDASQAKWFKIAQAGIKDYDSNGTAIWYQKDLYDGLPYTVQLPANIKAGQYLIRNEIIALHNAAHEYGAEFYPSCTQVNITGDGDGVPDATVSFPGGYDSADPGLITPDVYNPHYVYSKFPGPPLANLSAPGDGQGRSGPSDTPTSSGPSSTLRTDPSAPPSRAQSENETDTVTMATSSATGGSSAGGCGRPTAAATYERRRFSSLVRKRLLDRAYMRITDIGYT